MSTEIAVNEVPGLVEAMNALAKDGLTREGQEHIGKLVVGVAGPYIMAALLADVADDLREMPGLRTVGQVIDLLDAMSHHILEAVK